MQCLPAALRAGAGPARASACFTPRCVRELTAARQLSASDTNQLSGRCHLGRRALPASPYGKPKCDIGRQAVVAEAEAPGGGSGSTAVEEPKDEELLVPAILDRSAKDSARRFVVRSDKVADVVAAGLGGLFRLGSGAFVQGYSAKTVPAEDVEPDTFAYTLPGGRKLLESGATSSLPRPEKPIEIYEYEGCPMCRKVREAVSILDLDVLFYPCPRDGPTYRPKVVEMGGKQQFPYMVDPNTGTAMYESDDIVKYLASTYGDGTVPGSLSQGFVTTLTCGLSSLSRAGKGVRYTSARAIEKPLELWAYEVSPYCKVVREVLVELEIPHLYHSTARGSPTRTELLKRTGIFQVPYLEDPNTGMKMFESAEIVDYLQREYALA